MKLDAFIEELEKRHFAATTYWLEVKDLLPETEKHYAVVAETLAEVITMAKKIER